ncbi:bifunctional UDP-N-acetylglucosamine diphosphorylase/glucosamine-1-phosphate N-acetyltransferase GlmU [Candidatus Soleaferrea massiliensis]|uniref:bifunctional UDP-N-acetylglucosamine diphosphorylase/glucosamine-1-phosphate N-acetyltransferase GlmU n=1 Tax=Candidatus Soleaferrea massiliensis TaxID=1470354 RepID=UPI00058D69DD|nr:bifunctional UDP-N-acetylglucosamine diphosphorylase/glucosamine-1-phosphate N-acetyltransferase GlmU [Candidatus Soleaferrea massiliensis]
MENCCAVILAAGEGKRMKSSKPKVLCEVLFKPMVKWVVDSIEKAGIKQIGVICGNGAQAVQDALGEGYTYIQQKERRGTGHAVMQAKDFLHECGAKHVLILCGDAPFIDQETIRHAFEAHQKAGNAVTVITAKLDNPYGYGRIVRTDDGIERIVEQADATQDQLRIQEINSGAYWFSVSALLSALEKLTPNNAQGEYYLTDTVSILLQDGQRADGYLSANPDVILGANDRRQLLKLNEIARMKVIDRLLDEGVDFVNTDGIVISPDAQIGCDTRILQGTIIKGRVKIGSGSVIGPNSLVEDSTIGDDTIFNASQVYSSSIGNGVRIGPFSQIRPNCTIRDYVKIGDFVEIKNSTLDEKTSVAHLTYIGDSDFGKHINVGCGVVTVNYNGSQKFRTVVEDDCFIGCNTNLVAPVKVKKGAYTAAGTTVTRDVPENSLAVGRVKQENKEDWVIRRFSKK